MSDINLSRNQQIALVALIGITLLGLAYGKIRSAKPAQLREQAFTMTKPSATGDVSIDTPVVRASSSEANTRMVTVHVAGCVKHPSVYKLPVGSRVVDAIHAAGGPTSEANLDAINMAAKAQDGVQIYVPSKRDSIFSSAGASSGGKVSSAGGRSSSGGHFNGLVNINTAGIEELDKLPGVGPATAQKIIDYRNEIGRFTSIEQLEEVKGIGPKKMSQIRPYCQL